MYIKQLSKILLFIIIYNCFSPINSMEISINPKISFLGMVHFASNIDLASIETDDILTTKRQLEIEVLINQLASNKPTKIKLEHTCNSKYID